MQDEIPDVIDDTLKCRIMREGIMIGSLVLWVAVKKNLRELVEEATTNLHRTSGNCCKLEIFNSVNDEEDNNGSSEGISVSAILRS